MRRIHLGGGETKLLDAVHADAEDEQTDDESERGSGVQGDADEDRADQRDRQPEDQPGPAARICPSLARMDTRR